jgi:hypothetical protein
LVDQLGEEEFDRRERAERGLREASGLAAPALMAALERNTDLEVRTRCKRLLEAIPPAERARWSDRERLRAMLRGLRHERFPGGEALWEEIGRSFPDSLLSELVRSETEKKR